MRGTMHITFGTSTLFAFIPGGANSIDTKTKDTNTIDVNARNATRIQTHEYNTKSNTALLMRKERREWVVYE